MRSVLLVVFGWLVLSCGAGRHDDAQPPRPVDAHPALGDLGELPPQLARAFADDPAWFGPLHDLGDGDWLSSHDEPGQTVPQYLARGPNLPTAARDTIYIQPIGPFPAIAPSMEQLADYVERFFTLEVTVLEPIEVEALDARSREYDLGTQLRTGDVLDALRERLPGDAFLLVGLTMIDLYPDEDWNFVFGYASSRQRVAVYSLLRFDPRIDDPRSEPSEELRRLLILERSLKIVSHELTHSFGVRHCVHYDCVMNGVNHLRELDLHPLHLCPVCLRKLHLATEFDPAARYGELGDYYEARGLSDAATWAQSRATSLRAAE